MVLNNSINCYKCGKEVDLSHRYCPQCGQPIFVELTRDDLSSEKYLDVLNSVYNLVITKDSTERDKYYHPISRMLINKRYELEFDSLIKSPFGSFVRVDPSLFIEAIKTIIQSRSSNALTGYSSRVSEELISKRNTIPLEKEFIDNWINSFLKEFSEEHIVKNIASPISDKTIQKRILFIFYLQNDNKHMNYFLDEALLQKWFDNILITNQRMTFDNYKDAMSKIFRNPQKDIIYEDVLNDIVFGYCVKLAGMSKTRLFPSFRFTLLLTPN